jgi:subfamily B ATP-binding cassette protein MsbA
MADWRRNYGNLLRFYGYAVGHWRVIAMALAATVIYSAVRVNAVILIKPIVETLELRQATAAPPAGAAPSAEPLVPRGAADTGISQHLSQTKDKAVGWLRSIRPIDKALRWLSPRNGPKRIAFLLAVIIGPLVFVSSFLFEYAEGRVVWGIMADLRMAVFRRLSRLSLGYFSRQRTGELVSRLTNDINSTQAALRIVFGRALLEPVLLLVYLGAALYSSWQLTVTAMVTFPPTIAVMAWYGKRIRRYGAKNLERLADVTDAVTQVLSGIRVVKAFDMGRAENEAFQVRNEAQLNRAYKLVRNRALAEGLPEYLYVVPVALILIVGDHLMGKNELTVANMLQCMGALGFMAGPVRRIVRSYNDLQMSVPGVNRLFELLDTEPDVQDAPDAVELDGVREGIRFDRVWFAYNEQPVLKGINLSVPVGSIYAIVGETGAGKSTMLDLIPRFYDVKEGSVSIDGVDVRRIKLSSLMRQIAIVGQQPFLFNRSIAENIRYGKPDAAQEEIAAAARAANIHDFIESLPGGYQYVVGEGGSRLSGGQRQCVTIARAILKNAPILILDEATSNLDPESEMLVQRALNSLTRGRTTLVIAHRLSTVRHAHRIVVLKDGRIIEQGPHEELLRRGGEYAKLYNLQFAERG